MESKPQNPEFRNDPENFYLCIPKFHVMVQIILVLKSPTC